MIPKIIHLIFFGTWPFNDLNNRCHDSWSKVLPDWEIKRWTPDNIPSEAKPQWVIDALAPKTNGAISNGGAYIKFWLLNHFGGLYLDNDMELLKPVETHHAYFCGWQRDGEEADVNMSACACVPGHPFNQAIMQEILNRPVDDHPLAFGPLMFTRMLRARGLNGNNVEQTVEDIKVYRHDRFYPWFHTDKPDMSKVTDKTFGIHHWEATWTKENK